MITLSWLLIVTVLAAALSLYDGITRLRGKRGNSALAIAEIVFAALMLVSLFPIPVPFGTVLWAVLLEVVLILVLVLRGSGRKGVSTVTIIALILNSIVVLIAAGWLHIPGLG